MEYRNKNIEPETEFQDVRINIENNDNNIENIESEIVNNNEENTIEMLSREILNINEENKCYQPFVEVLDQRNIAKDRLAGCETIITKEGGRGGEQKVYFTSPIRRDLSGEVLEYEPSSRNNFVRKVCAITFLMLAFTAGWIVTVLLNEDIREFFEDEALVLIIMGSIVAVTIGYAMYCSQCSRRPPCSFICLILNTVAYSVIASVISTKYNTELVFYAFLTTAIVVFICIILAMSSFDFTSWLLFVIGISVVAGVVALCLTLTQVVLGTNWKPVQIAMLLLMTLLQTIMLIIQLQMILGGRQVELNENDYCLGAFMLYNSIIELFLKLLTLLSKL